MWGPLLPTWDDLRDRPPLATPLLVGWMLAAVSLVVLRPLALGSGAAGEAVATLLVVGAALAPIPLALRAGVLALAAWSVLVLTGRTPRARTLLSACLYGEVILLLQDLLLPLWFALVPPGSGPDGATATAPFSLQPLTFALPPWIGAAVGGLTPIHLAWVVFLLAALRQAEGVSRRAAITTVGLLWTARVAVAAAPTLLAG